MTSSSGRRAHPKHLAALSPDEPVHGACWQSDTPSLSCNVLREYVKVPIPSVHMFFCLDVYSDKPSQPEVMQWL